ncbi:acyltransferase family protein [Candidatus Weimeria sp. HCP3S3_B5]|uniref:acyltransferase family protein n=1 Tax=Candidatus Weimeria sp. HCP3S3_B5 TaxID=3438871 RepID=UPI003F8A52A9
MVCIHNYPVGYLWVCIRPIFNFAVGAFLFLSGLLTVKQEHWKHFFLRRIQRVLIPYIIWSCIYTLAYRHFSDFVYNLLTFQCCDIYYYLAVYIQCILLTPLLISLLNSRWRIIGYFITPVFILIMYYAIWNGNPFQYPWNAIFFPAWGTYYYYGLDLRNRHEQGKGIMFRRRELLLFIVSFIAQIFEGIIWYKYYDYTMATGQIKLTSLVTSLLICLFFATRIYSSKVARNGLTKLLVKIGDYSFGIYLSHILLMAVLYKTLYVIMPKIFPVDVIIVIVLSMAWMSIAENILKKIPRGSKLIKFLGIR